MFQRPGTYKLGLIVAIILIIIYIIMTLYVSYISKNKEKDPDYQKLESQINAVFISEVNEDDEVSLIDIHKAKKASRNITDVFSIFGLKSPNVKGIRVALFLIPCLILTLVFIPRFISSKAIIDERNDQVIDVMNELSDAFDGAWDIYMTTPEEEYSEYGYYFSAYLDSDNSSNIMIGVSNSGYIDYVAYDVRFDPYLEAEEALVYIQDILDAYYDRLSTIDINTKFKKEPIISESFKTAFLAAYESSDPNISITTGDVYESLYVYSDEYGTDATFSYSILE